ELPVVLAQGQIFVADPLAADLFPGREACGDRGDRRQRPCFELDVDLPAREVVHDGHVVVAVRQMQCRGPSTEPVAAQHHYLWHRSLLLGLTVANLEASVRSRDTTSGARPRRDLIE